MTFRSFAAAAILAACCLHASLRAQDNRDSWQNVLNAQTQAREARLKAACAALRAAKPFVHRLQNSISLRGDGVGDLSKFSRNDSYQYIKEILLPTGTLYYVLGEDFDDRMVWAHFSGNYGLREVLKERHDSLAASMKAGGDPAYCNGEIRKLAQIRTPAELAALDKLSGYDGMLQPPNNLSAAQIKRVRDAFAKRQERAQELARMLGGKPGSPGETLEAAAIWNLASQMDQDAAFADNQQEFLTPAQRKAIPNPFADGGGACAQVSGGAYCQASCDTGPSEAEAAREVAACRKAAKVAFTLNDVEALKSSTVLQTSEGWLRIFADPLPNKAGTAFAFFLDEKHAWNAERVAMQNNPRVTDREELAKSKCYQEYNIRGKLAQYYRVAGEIPPDMQQRADAMIAAVDQAFAAALAAYRLVESNPSDEAARLALVRAVRDARQSEQRSYTLSSRTFYDPEYLRDDIPWLFNADQCEIIARTEPGSGMVSRSGPDGRLVLNAKPSGGKQFVNIVVEGYKLKDAIPEIQDGARKYFHYRKLTLKLDPSLEGKSIKGTIEGKSLEEFLKSLATRAGVSLVKDPAAEYTWTLRP